MVALRDARSAARMAHDSAVLGLERANAAIARAQAFHNAEVDRINSMAIPSRKPKTNAGRKKKKTEDPIPQEEEFSMDADEP